MWQRAGETRGKRAPFHLPELSGGSMEGAKDRGACALHSCTIR